jgi:hypothetical protein
MKHKDKIKHFAISAAIVFSCSLFMPLWVGVILALAIGFVKERLDKVFDWYDIIADVAGITFAIIIERFI